jgi:hypothetical protein
MVAMIRTAKGRVVNPRATITETKAALRVGCKLAAVVGFGAGRLVQGRILGIEGERVKIDTEPEPIDARDVIAIKLDNEGAENGRQTATTTS